MSKELFIIASDKNELHSEVLRVSHTEDMTRKDAYKTVVERVNEVIPNYAPYSSYESFRIVNNRKR